MKTLRLSVNEGWYNLIVSGQINCDYREVKPYWTSRLEDKVYDIVEFYHRFKKDVKPVRYKFEWINKQHLKNYDKLVYIIKFGEKVE
jgi:hypothetical protein